MKRLLIRDNNVFNTVQKETKTDTESYTYVSTQKITISFSNSDITLLVERRESNDINLVLYADPAGTGTQKEHVHIYNTVLWLNRQMQMQLYTPDATQHFHSKFPFNASNVSNSKKLGFTQFQLKQADQWKYVSEEKS